MTNRDVMGKKCFGDLQNNHDSEHLSLDLCGLTVPCGFFTWKKTV